MAELDVEGGFEGVVCLLAVFGGIFVDRLLFILQDGWWCKVVVFCGRRTSRGVSNSVEKVEDEGDDEGVQDDSNTMHSSHSGHLLIIAELVHCVFVTWWGLVEVTISNVATKVYSGDSRERGS